MKKIFLTLIIFFVTSITMFADAPAPPSQSGGGGTGGPPIGGGSPIDGGLGILLAMGIAYGSKKVYKLYKSNSQE